MEDENHQDKTESGLSTTKDKIWQPPLLTKIHMKVDQFQKKPFTERRGLKGKTIWDWLQLLIIPLVRAVSCDIIEGKKRTHDTFRQMAHFCGSCALCVIPQERRKRAERKTCWQSQLVNTCSQVMLELSHKVRMNHFCTNRCPIPV